MALTDFIEKIQNKPEHVRSRILWLSVSVSMALVLTFWVSSLNATFSGIREPESADSQSAGMARKPAPSLIGALKASVVSFFEKDESSNSDLEIIKVENETEQELFEDIKPVKLPQAE